MNTFVMLRATLGAVNQYQEKNLCLNQETLQCYISEMYTRDNNIKFTDFRIVRLNFSINNEFSTSTRRAEVDTKFQIRHELQGNRLKVFLTIEFRDNPIQKTPFLLKIEGSAIFVMQYPPNDAEIQSLVKHHCAAAMFPYLRETIADITRRAGFPPLHIPQIDFTREFAQQAESGPVQSHSLH